MGLFDAFERKNCDVCGEKVGLLGGTKLKDGRLCKKCAAKLSPWISGLRGFTLEDIDRHLAEREENLEVVRNFNITHVVGNGYTKLYIDLDNQLAVITSNSNWRSSNPDVFRFSQLVSCDMNIHETETELKQKDPEGKEVSYNPKRFEYSYNFNVTLNVNSEWYNTVTFRMNNSTVKGFDNDQYDKYYLACEEMCEVIYALIGGDRDDIEETIAYYKKLAAQTSVKYDSSYYTRTSYRTVGRGSRDQNYYRQRDPRSNHYRF